MSAPGSLAARLRSETKSLHSEVERAGMMPQMLSGRLDRLTYCHLLRNFHAIYQALEAALNRHRGLAPVAAVWFAGLARMPALERDLLDLYGDRWLQELPVAEAGERYVRRLAELDQRDPLLYARWIQAAVFSAHMRLHGIGAREPWSYGEAVEKIAMDALDLRYRLLPYLQHAIAQSAATGLPVQRAMVLACPQDRAAWAFEDQFFFGDDLLVAPCLRPDGLVTVYLPAGEWVRFPGREPFAGGRCHALTLAATELAVFARRHSRIPLGPAAAPLQRQVETESTWIA